MLLSMVVGVFGNNKILAILPARGGSKRIPKKNIRNFAGKPMIGWTIEAAIGSRYIDRVVVSTDSREIQAVSERLGVEVPFLRAEHANDIAPVSLATLTAVEQAENIWGEFDVVVQLMPNCPLRRSDTIDAGIEQYFKDAGNSQISYFKFGWMNPWWAHTIDSCDSPKALFPEATVSRSQDLETLYCPTGAVWVSDKKNLKKYKSFYSPDFKAFVVDWVSALDIDDEDDFKMGEAVFRLKELKR